MARVFGFSVSRSRTIAVPLRGVLPRLKNSRELLGKLNSTAVGRDGKVCKSVVGTVKIWDVLLEFTEIDFLSEPFAVGNAPKLDCKSAGGRDRMAVRHESGRPQHSLNLDL